MSMATQKFSRAAYERLHTEYEDLTTRGRIQVAEKIERAREEGDLSENAGYHAAKDEQGHMEGRIRQLEHMLEDAEIADDQYVYTVLYDGDSPDQAERYLVGHLEEQVEGATLVSPSSPLGTALQGASEGQQLSYQAPNGALTVTVLKVEPV
jgi:transcription elongation factor GreA